MESIFEELDGFLCPITREVLQDPVITCDGITYERKAIEEWFSCGNGETVVTSPMTGMPLPVMTLIPNVALKKVLEESYLEISAMNKKVLELESEVSTFRMENDLKEGKRGESQDDGTPLVAKQRKLFSNKMEWCQGELHRIANEKQHIDQLLEEYLLVLESKRIRLEVIEESIQENIPKRTRIETQIRNLENRYEIPPSLKERILEEGNEDDDDEEEEEFVVEEEDEGDVVEEEEEEGDVVEEEEEEEGDVVEEEEEEEEEEGEGEGEEGEEEGKEETSVVFREYAEILRGLRFFKDTSRELEERQCAIVEEIDRDQSEQLRCQNRRAELQEEKNSREAEIERLNELKQTVVPFSQLKNSLGFQPRELNVAGYAALDLWSAEFTVTEIREGGYEVRELSGVPPRLLREGGYSVMEMREAGYQARQLLQAGYRIAAMKEGGFSGLEMIHAGEDLDRVLKHYSVKSVTKELRKKKSKSLRA
jgi:hypothetical protein